MESSRNKQTGDSWGEAHQVLDTNRYADASESSQEQFFCCDSNQCYLSDKVLHTLTKILAYSAYTVILDLSVLRLSSLSTCPTAAHALTVSI